MIGAVSYKTKQFFSLLIKLSIVVGAVYFIYNKLFNNEQLDFNVFVAYLKTNHVFSTKNIFLLLLLSCLNWFFEILKWQNLTNFIKRISFSEALKQSLASLTASLFTPNRIGEYGVKAMYFTPKFRKRVLLLNLISNIAQMSITTIIGIIGFSIFHNKYDTGITPYNITRVVLLFAFVFGLIFFGSKQKQFKIKGFSISKIRDFITSIPLSIHAKNVMYSLIRYAVFSFQFYWLLVIFGVDVYYLNAMILISSFYLISSIIPTIFIFDMVVKGSVGLYLFEIIGVNSLTILSITTLMWILNFVIPSTFGSIYVLKYDSKKLFKSES